MGGGGGPYIFRKFQIYEAPSFNSEMFWKYPFIYSSDFIYILLCLGDILIFTNTSIWVYVLLHLYIYKFGLSVCLFVCLFVSNKRQNGWTDRAQFFCGTSRDHREGLWMIKISNICLHQNSIFIKFLKILKIHDFLWKSANYFCFVLRCTQREHVHN